MAPRKETKEMTRLGGVFAWSLSRSGDGMGPMQDAHQPIPTVNDRYGWRLSDPDCYLPSEYFVQMNQDSDF